MVVVRTKSVEETEKLGSIIGKFLRPKDVVALVGELGAGKTALTRGIAKGMGIKEYVVSPTFTIINFYKGVVPFVHVDAYRVESEEELEEAGFSDFLDECAVVVEWADKVKNLLPESSLWIEIYYVDTIEREFRIYGKTPLVSIIQKELMQS
ncbi:tRNA (adenosine(37)-N6)-threonylcarbamoyltransferase complex ATPase subunit type 1 TsaE [Thermovenabulum sp.]|uniref:tRNA (adenosine(37)-N6)-threonylcarbamoyltransferase complex ATPase subunit type 1 TsaE n=1 Tax=Thermovenabulum sp. TaxID=3100335 RepID=UPI003C7973DB